LACCVAHDFEGWCKDLDVVRGEDGEDYCVFHASGSEKGVALEEFNALVFQRIENVKNANKKAPGQERVCDLSGTIFEGDIDFGDCPGEPGLPGINFQRTEFSGKVSFGAEQFRGRMNFGGAKFRGETRFENTQFTWGVNFGSTQFRGGAIFRAARFKGRVSFGSAKFEGETRFENTQFNKEVNFGGAQFSGEASFGGTEFSGEVSFHAAEFSGKTMFFASRFNEAAYFTGLTIRKRPVFSDMTLDDICFADTDVRKADFINCTWREKRGRRIVHDEIKLSSIPTDLKTKLRLQRVAPGNTANAIQKIETLYRRLKDKCRKDHSEREASMWHYSEKEMQRKRSGFRSPFEFLMLHLYWFSSGYGERPVRALAVLLGLIAAACAGLSYFDLGFTGSPGGFHKFTSVGLDGDFSWDYFGAVVVNVFKYLTFQRDAFLMPRTMEGEYVKLAAQLLIPAQTALFILALRNRFRR
jgi:uncharacterized protein YjbI with pentapeptide repeats